MSEPKSQQPQQSQTPSTSNRSAAPTQAQPQELPFPAVSFTVEFSGPQNEKIAWPMNQAIVRGRWKGEAVRKIGGAEAMATVSDLPGMMLYFDSSKRAYVIYDPLNQPKNKEQQKKHSEQIAAVYMVKSGPEREYFCENMSPNAMKTVCYMARRLFDNNQLIVHNGVIPEVEDIERMPGTIEFNQSHLNPGLQGIRIESLKNYRTPRDAADGGREPVLTIEAPQL